MFLSPKFSWRPHQRAPGHPHAQVVEQAVENCAVVFVHAERHDDDGTSKLLTKFLKNVKWIAKKRGTGNVVLHSFSHLSESKAPPEFAEQFLIDAAGRLERAGYRVQLTPFGYSCAWRLAVHGEPIAKVFKSL